MFNGNRCTFATKSSISAAKFVAEMVRLRACLRFNKYEIFFELFSIAIVYIIHKTVLMDFCSKKGAPCLTRAL